jgi:RNA polymerase sigma-70 factor (ECF subfamily)
VSQSQLDPSSDSVPDLESAETDKGRTEEFDRFFSEYFKKIVRTVMLAGATYEDACDAVQEAMVLAAGRFGELRYPAAWVRRVAVRIHNRRKARNTEVHRREQLATPRPPTSKQSEVEAFRNAVRSVLRGLPRVQRMTMALSMDDHSPTEIAEILGKPATTVRANLRHARRAMAAGLKKGGWNV